MKAYKHLVQFMLARGYVISVGSEGVTDLKRSSDGKAIIEAIEAVDEAAIRIRLKDAGHGGHLASALIIAHGMADDETVADFSDNPLMTEWQLTYDALPPEGEPAPARKTQVQHLVEFMLQRGFILAVVNIEWTKTLQGPTRVERDIVQAMESATSSSLQIYQPTATGDCRSMEGWAKFAGNGAEQQLMHMPQTGLMEEWRTAYRFYREGRPEPTVALASPELFVPDGWAESSPGGLMTNTNPFIGGLIDHEGVTDRGKWFVVPHADNLSAQFETPRWPTRWEAYNALQVALGSTLRINGCTNCDGDGWKTVTVEETGLSQRLPCHLCNAELAARGTSTACLRRDATAEEIEDIATQQEPAERGAASILIELTGGNITVYHGTDKTILAQGLAVPKGSWEQLWKTLDRFCVRTYPEMVPSLQEVTDFIREEFGDPNRIVPPDCWENFVTTPPGLVCPSGNVLPAIELHNRWTAIPDDSSIKSLNGITFDDRYEAYQALVRACKPKPDVSPAAHVMSRQAAVKTLEALGYTYTDGAEQWKPPVGKYRPDFTTELVSALRQYQHIGYGNSLDHGAQADAYQNARVLLDRIDRANSRNPVDWADQPNAPQQLQLIVGMDYEYTGPNDHNLRRIRYCGQNGPTRRFSQVTEDGTPGFTFYLPPELLSYLRPVQAADTITLDRRTAMQLHSMTRDLIDLDEAETEAFETLDRLIASNPTGADVHDSEVHGRGRGDYDAADPALDGAP